LKKIFAILLAALFVLSFAASAFAIHAEIPSETQAVVGAGTVQITLGGELRVRGWYTDNIGMADFGTVNANHGSWEDYDHSIGNWYDYVRHSQYRFISKGFAPVKSNSAAWYDERVRLSLDAKVSPNVEGFVQLESSNTSNGSNGFHEDSYTWGNFDAKPDTLSILQAWILYSGSGLLGIPAGIKIGHMPLALGNSTFFDHTKYGDDAIVLFAVPAKELEIDALTIKFAGDGNPLVLPTVNVNTDGAPYGAINNNNADLDGYVGIVTYKLDDKNTLGVNYTYLNLSQYEFTHQNLEFVANGAFGGVGYKVSGDVQFGHTANMLLGVASNSTRDFRGYAIQAGLSYDIQPVTLRGSFAYGSGFDNSSGKDKQFETYLGDDQHYTFVYEYNVMSAAGRLNSGLSNTTYYNLGVDVKPVKDLSASLDYYLLRATEGNVIFPNGYQGSYGRRDEHTFSDLTLRTDLSKSVGWELDAKVVYNVAKNLTYEIDAGYMHAGDFYKDLFHYSCVDVKSPTVLMHKLTLSF
jgi:hypothetical protein